MFHGIVRAIASPDPLKHVLRSEFHFLRASHDAAAQSAESHCLSLHALASAIDQTKLKKSERKELGQYLQRALATARVMRGHKS